MILNQTLPPRWNKRRAPAVNAPSTSSAPGSLQRFSTHRFERFISQHGDFGGSGYVRKMEGRPKTYPTKKTWRFRSCGLSSQLRTGDHDVSVISMCCCPKGPQRPPMYQLELSLKDHLVSSPDSLEVCLHCCWPGVRIPLFYCHVQLWALLFTGNVDLEIAKEASNTHMYWKGCTYIQICI